MWKDLWVCPDYLFRRSTHGSPWENSNLWEISSLGSSQSDRHSRSSFLTRWRCMPISASRRHVALDGVCFMSAVDALGQKSEIFSDIFYFQLVRPWTHHRRMNSVIDKFEGEKERKEKEEEENGWWFISRCWINSHCHHRRIRQNKVVICWWLPRRLLGRKVGPEKEEKENICDLCHP